MNFVLRKYELLRGPHGAGPRLKSPSIAIISPVGPFQRRTEGTLEETLQLLIAPFPPTEAVALKYLHF